MRKQQKGLEIQALLLSYGAQDTAARTPYYGQQEAFLPAAGLP